MMHRKRYTSLESKGDVYSFEQILEAYNSICKKAPYAVLIYTKKLKQLTIHDIDAANCSKFIEI